MRVFGGRGMRTTSGVPAVAAIGSAGTSFLVALAAVAIPVLGAQAFDSRTGSSALDAVIIAVAILVTGHGGAVALTGLGIEGLVTLTPLGLTFLFFLVSVASARRLGIRLGVLERDGRLRPGALRTLGVAWVSYSLAYAVFVTLVAMVGTSSTVRPVPLSAFVSSLALSALAAFMGLASALTRNSSRRGTSSRAATGFLGLLPPSLAAGVSGVVAASVFALAGASVVLALQIVLRRGALTQLYEQLDADVFGGAVLTLGQLAFLPTLIVWVLVLACGGTVAVGVGTGISLAGATLGVMPAVPVLGALPEPGEFSPWLKALMAIPVVAVLLGALLVARHAATLTVRERVIAWITYPLLLMAVLVLLAALSGGSIGSAQLSQIGPILTSLMLPLALIVLVPSLVVVVSVESGLAAWIGSVTRRAARASASS